MAVAMLHLLPLQARTTFVIFISRLSRTAKVGSVPLLTQFSAPCSSAIKHGLGPASAKLARQGFE